LFGASRRSGSIAGNVTERTSVEVLLD
jgi:hypothetical protein